MADEALAQFIEEVCGESHLRVETDLGGGFVRLRVSEAERRQAAHDIRSTEDVVIELLRNARDAHAHTIFVAFTREGSARRVVVIDDGDGVPPAMHERVFEPRVTSKLDSVHMDKWGIHGRGMALYSIAVNATRACILASDVHLGSSFLVETDLDHIGEKRDQSTFPSFQLNETGAVSVRGPRNVVRCACEFAIDCHRTCSVYLGSATDVAASLYAYGLDRLSGQQRAFCDDLDRLPVCERLSTAADPADFARIAARLGLQLSERSARRIMDGHITPLASLTDQVRIKGVDDSSSRSESTGEQVAASALAHPLALPKHVKVSSQDIAAFSHDVSKAFAPLAQAYYLEDGVEPAVRIRGNALHITVPLIPVDNV